MEALPVPKVLVVDDHAANLIATSAALQGLDVDLVTAQSGAEALHALLKNEFCVVLMDVQMPGMDGFQTAEIIRSRPRSRDIPIIFFTAINQANEHVEKGYELGAVDYVFKPVPAEMLRSKVTVFAELARRRAMIQHQSTLIARSEAQYRQLVEKTPATVYTAGTEAFGNTHFMSPQIERILGIPASSFVGEPDLWIRHVHTEDRKRVRRMFARAVAERSPFTAEYRMLTADGQVVWIRDEAVFIEAGLAGAEHIQGVRQDVTERRLAREALQATNNTLRVTADELRKANSEVELSNRELETFNSAVAHDLRAPLRSIAGFSATLLEDYHHKVDEEGQYLLRRIVSASDWMARLIDDLLHLSHCSHDPMRVGPVNLSELAASCLADLREAAPEREVKVKIEPGLTAQGDSRLLRIALDNLLRNAWKFTSKKEKATIEMGRDLETGAYFVKDDGAGFDMAYARGLFEAFQRLHRQDEFEGNGIGLLTVKRVIERHNGKLWGYGELEKGATFSFTLPVQTPPPALTAPSAPPAQPPASTSKGSGRPRSTRRRA